ncbi:MAG: hypothetical protein ACO3FQ_08510, partial [Terrimicrobiaceae bacterium]
MSTRTIPHLHTASLLRVFATVMLASFSLPAEADERGNRWDEIVGKRVYNRKGEFLGHVSGA